MPQNLSCLKTSDAPVTSPPKNECEPGPGLLGLVSRHFINGGDSSSSGDPRSNGSAYSFSFGPDFHVPSRGRFIKLINVLSYSPNVLIPITFCSQKRCELRQGTRCRKSLKFTMPSWRD